MFQSNLEDLTHRSQQSLIYRELIKNSNLINQFPPNPIPSETWMKLFIKSLELRKSNPTILIAATAKYFTSTQEAASCIQWCCLHNYLIYKDNHIYPSIPVSHETQLQIDSLGYPYPLTIPPKKIHENNQSGYYQNQGSILQNNATTESDVNLDFINLINATPLCYLEDVANKVPSCVPTKPEQIKPYLKFIKVIATSRKLLPKTIYLTHGYDRRGRIYARGYHYNYQGADHNKATLTIHTEENLKP